MKFEREWHCFWTGIMPSKIPLTCTHLIEYVLYQEIVDKCKKLRFKKLCDLVKTCKWNPGDPFAPISNEYPKFLP